MDDTWKLNLLIKDWTEPCSWFFSWLSTSPWDVDTHLPHFCSLSLAGPKHRFLNLSLPSSHSLVFEQNGWASDHSLTKAAFLDPFQQLFSFNHVAHKTCAAVPFLVMSPRDLKIDYVLDNFALENTPGPWLNIVIVEKLAASGPRPLEQVLLFIFAD